MARAWTTTGKGGFERVTFSHLRVLVTMILLDEAAGTIVGPSPRGLSLRNFRTLRNDLNRTRNEDDAVIILYA